MRRSLRQQVRIRYNFSCGYCGVSETQVGAELTIDHFQPQVAGGSDDLDNLVYCCPACNSFKGDRWFPNSDERLLHPQQDNISEHLVEEESGRLMGKTPTGQFHIDHLQLNRPALIQHRLQEQHFQRLEVERVALLQELRETQGELSNLLRQFGVHRP